MFCPLDLETAARKPRNLEFVRLSVCDLIVALRAWTFFSRSRTRVSAARSLVCAAAAWAESCFSSAPMRAAAVTTSAALSASSFSSASIRACAASSSVERIAPSALASASSRSALCKLVSAARWASCFLINSACEASSAFASRETSAVFGTLIVFVVEPYPSLSHVTPPTVMHRSVVGLSILPGAHVLVPGTFLNSSCSGKPPL